MKRAKTDWEEQENYNPAKDGDQMYQEPNGRVHRGKQLLKATNVRVVITTHSEMKLPHR